jgi:3',5'-cyclic-AMP phosphodiesterase
MRLAWMTDIHVNFLDEAATARFHAEVRRQAPDALAISGDIAESQSVAGALLHLTAGCGCPVYFVMGNHDYYRSSIAQTRSRIETLTADVPQLVYLSAQEFVELGPDTALVGHDGWADARLGNFERSDVLLNDYLLIEELRKWIDLFTLDRPALLAELHRLGDEAAEHFRRIIPAALETHRQVVVLTHVPPYREACCHAGKISDDNWLPHFSCAAVGDALSELMDARPDRQMLVLCGHTHCEADLQVLPNLRVLTGAAEYGGPVIQRVFEFE